MKPIVKKMIGLYEKFRVERTDGRSAPGEKHDGCAYFVLDLTHDPLAISAVAAYAKAAKAGGYDELATDLRLAVSRMERGVFPRMALQPWDGPDGVAALARILEKQLEQDDES